MFQVKVRSHFDAAHFLKDYDGKCNRMHGHRWVTEVVVEGLTLDKRKMLIDFGDLREEIGHLIERIDHFVLNDQLNEDNPTAELIAFWMYHQISGGLHDSSSLDFRGRGLRVVSVEVWESPECSAKFIGAQV